MNLLAGFSDISIWQLVAVGAVAFCANVLGGLAGYGTGALLPLVLVPLIGAAPVVPIIAIAAMFTNTGRVLAFRAHADWRRAAIALAAATPTCIVGAWGYTFLTGKGAAIVIGAMLMLSVPLRRLLKQRGVRFGDLGFAAGSFGYGVLVGGTAGSGVIMLSLLMAAGLAGSAVVATDAMISIVITVVKIVVFGAAGVLTAQVIAFALLIGVCALPGPFLARALLARMPVHFHAVILDAVVLFGGAMLVIDGLRG
jgi:uncharacterized membrane protein YfcA